MTALAGRPGSPRRGGGSEISRRSGFRFGAGFFGAAAMLMAATEQSVIHPVGPQAGRIAHLFWFFLGLLTVIFVIVIVTMLWAIARRQRGIEQEPLEHAHIPSTQTEERLTRVVASATVVTVLILFGLLILSVSTGKAISRLSPQNALTVEITGNQWWWYVRYPNDDPRRIVVTANEIHIPTGRPVMIRGMSNDVIHSFWVPNLHGKRDLIPSRISVDWIQADEPGQYRGQCAEFCGLQHAHMAIWVVAEPEDKFEMWMQRQLQPAIEPADPHLAQGRQVFLNHACVFCHHIAGTTAAGQVAPDLTHIGGRMTIAAGTLPNTKGNLAGWITDPQNIKPGNHMANLQIKPEDMQALVDYLESLQ